MKNDSTMVKVKIQKRQTERLGHSGCNAGVSLLVVVTLFVMFTISLAIAASPTLSSVEPRGGQRGSSMTMSLHGGNLQDAQEVLFYSPGITVNELKVEGGGKVDANINIADDCRLGEHFLRVRTATGVSTLRTFWVGPYAAVAEVEPNSDFNQPQPVPFNSTIIGTVENEDVDYFVIEAKKGQRISAEIEGIRLGLTMFDTYVAIQDMKRFELVASDDTSLLLQDSLVSVIAPDDGQYVIQVRESAYGGSGACRYRLHVGGFPRPLAVYPPGGKVGSEMEVTYVGDVTAGMAETIQLSAQPQDRFELFAQHDGQWSPSPNYFRVVEYDNVLEAEPNNSYDQATVTDQPLPLAFNGIIGETSDVDWFAVTAKAGEQYDVRVHARSVRSPLDSVLSIHDANGSQIVHNDDQGGPDSAFRFKFPADGQYYIRVHDHLSAGGAAYVYRVEFTPIKPRLTVSIPYFDGRDSQLRQMIAVPRGNRTAALLNVVRDNFGGDVVYVADDLPEGVTLHAATLPSNLGQFPVVFEAVAEAPVAGRLINMGGRHADENQNIAGQFSHKIILVEDKQTSYYIRHVDKLAIVVGEAAPYSIDIVAPKVPVVRNGKMNLKVVADRREGFEDAITVRLLWRPPGIGATSTVSIPQGQNEVLYPISADGGAQVNTWKIVVLGEAGGHLVASNLTDLTVASPYVSMKIEMAFLEQGESGEIVCKLEQHTAFEGPAEVILFGLPHKVITTPKQITKDDAELVFDITTDKESPAGKHKNLFCRVVVNQLGESIVHNIGHGGVLRIDPPPPPKKDEPKQSEAPSKPQKKTVKRLTRLETLRLQAKERAAARR